MESNIIHKTVTPLENIQNAILESLNIQFSSSKNAAIRQMKCTINDLIDLNITGNESDYEVSIIARDLYWDIVEY